MVLVNVVLSLFLAFRKNVFTMYPKKLKNNLPLLNIPGQGRKRASTAVQDQNLL